MKEHKFKNVVRGLLTVSFISLVVYLLTSSDLIPRLDGGLPAEIMAFDDKQELFSSDLSLVMLYVILALTALLILLIYGLCWFMRREGVYITILMIFACLPLGGLGYVNFETNYTQFLADVTDITFTIASVMIFFRKKLIH